MRSPSRLTTSTVTSSETFSRTRNSLLSRALSPLGEKYRARPVTVITEGALFRRWATKKAEKVAPTSTRNVTRATSVIALMRLGTLVGADDHDHVPSLVRAGNQRLRRRV